MSPRPEHRGAVGDDGDQVAARGVAERVGRVGDDLLAGRRDAGRVGQRQVALVDQLLGRGDRDLAGRRELVVFERGAAQFGGLLFGARHRAVSVDGSVGHAFLLMLGANDCRSDGSRRCRRSAADNAAAVARRASRWPRRMHPVHRCAAAMPIGEFDLIDKYFTRPAPACRAGRRRRLRAVRRRARHAARGLDRHAGRGPAFPADRRARAARPQGAGGQPAATSPPAAPRPLAFTLALALPRVDEAFLAGFARGLFALADAHGCELVGGDTTPGR